MKKNLTLVFVSILFSITAFAQNSWVNKNAFTGSGRMKSAYFAVNGKGYVVGGRTATTPTTYTNQVWQYDPANDSWLQKANFPITAAGSSAFVINNTAYVVGGQDNTFQIVSNFYQYSSANDTYTPKAAYPGNGITTAFSFSINGKGYVGSGTRQGASQPTNEFYMYDSAQNSWTPKAAVPDSLRVGAIGFSIGGYGYAGLGTAGTGIQYNDFYKYDPGNNTWTPIASFPGKPRQEPVAFVLNGKAYVGAGFRTFLATPDNIFFSMGDMYEYDPQTDTWSPAPSLPGVPRGAPSSFTIDNSAFVVNGYEWDGAAYYNYVSEFTTCNNLISGGIAAPAEDLQQMRVFPNPASQELNVAIDGFVRTKLDYEIITTEGRLVKQGLADNGNFNISIKDLAQGMYYLNVKDGTTRYAAQSFAVIK